MCDAVVMKDSLLLRYVPDWFVTHQQIKIWYKDDDYCNDDEVIDGIKSMKNGRSKNQK